MRKVTCMCEASFEADLPETVDLDEKGEALAEILSGDFFALTCPNCGNRLKPELARKDRLEEAGPGRDGAAGGGALLALYGHGRAYRRARKSSWATRSCTSARRCSKMGSIPRR